MEEIGSIKVGNAGREHGEHGGNGEHGGEKIEIEKI